MKSFYVLSALTFVGSAFAGPASVTLSSTASSAAPSTSAAGSSTGKSATVKSSAAAANSTSATASTSDVIPTGISANCTAYLNTLNADPTFESCTAPLLDATSAFAPDANNDALSTSTLVSTLDTLCAASGCKDTFIRTQLTSFYQACKSELLDANAAVLDTYDILYIMQPLTAALCTKDSGTYCVLKAPSNATSTAASASSSSPASAVANAAANYVSSGDGSGSDLDITNNAIQTFKSGGLASTPAPSVKRRSPAASTNSTQSSSTSSSGQSVIQYAPDTATYRESNVMYLFTTPSLSAASLCTTCTQAILTVYAKWEAATPYGCGLSKSPMLGGQAELWTAASAKCGSTWMSKVQGAVGPVVHGVSGALEGGSQATVSFTAMKGGVLALVAVAVSAMFTL
ncbi:hypothetical protein FRB94_004269 [Tulasnella sp. JGI-2019a]|nr:hypothetical protein FRB94_004269 [Tulasnella sp. JGI-2019a]